MFVGIKLVFLFGVTRFRFLLGIRLEFLLARLLVAFKFVGVLMLAFMLMVGFGIVFAG